jgi:hypothetical protein
MLGNLNLEQVERRSGFVFNQEDKELWRKYHNSNAELKGMDVCFHVFDIPFFVLLKGDEMKDIILKMFAPEKQINKGEQLHAGFI